VVSRLGLKGRNHRDGWALIPESRGEGGEGEEKGEERRRRRRVPYVPRARGTAFTQSHGPNRAEDQRECKKGCFKYFLSCFQMGRGWI
jgi:hypothetical protein